MFKKLSEIDTVTFANVLRMCDSFKPYLTAVCELVGDIKLRNDNTTSYQTVASDWTGLL